MQKLILTLFLCITLTTTSAIAVSTPQKDTFSNNPAVATEVPTGVGDSTETLTESKLSPEAKKLIAAAAGSGTIAVAAMVYIFKKQGK